MLASRFKLYSGLGKPAAHRCMIGLQRFISLGRVLGIACLILTQPNRELVGQIDVAGLTVQRIAQGYADNEFSAVEITKAHLKQIATFEPNYNAFIALNPEALETAAELDREREASGPRGPLHGVPVVVKDSIDVAGIPTTGGYAGFRGQVDLIPAMDAPVVARLKRAGAIILGKTNMPAFALSTKGTDGSWDGDTYNAHDRSLAPGGSSTGTATAVAASFAVLGLGEETAGSIQYPAGAQNLVGVKPTFGLIPNVGVAPVASSTRDVVGPMSRTVFDAAVALDAIAGPTPEDPKTQLSVGRLPENGYMSLLTSSALRGKRIGLYGPGWRSERPTPETRALYEAAQAVLVQEGAILVDDPFAESEFTSVSRSPLLGFDSLVFDWERYLDRILVPPSGNSLEHLRTMTGVELFGGAGTPLSRFFEQWLPDLADATKTPDVLPNLENFHKARNELRSEFSRVMEEHDLDALLFPQLLSETPSLGSGAFNSSSVPEINILGTPGVTVPGGYYASGAPFSLMFLGDPFSEAELLAYAYDYEQATLHRVAPHLLNAADINADGKVDFTDFMILRENFGKRRSGARRGDLNSDRIVDFADFLILSSNFGYGATTVSGRSTPEPSTISLLIPGLVLLVLTSRRMRGRRESTDKLQLACTQMRQAFTLVEVLVVRLFDLG